MLQKLFNPEWQITSKSFLLSTFLIGFSFSPTAEISRLELEFEESLLRKTASIFKEGIGQESNGAANQEKQIFLLCQILPSASSTRDLGRRLEGWLFSQARLEPITSTDKCTFVHEISKTEFCLSCMQILQMHF